jgi:hypothetical protein
MKRLSNSCRIRVRRESVTTGRQPILILAFVVALSGVSLATIAGGALPLSSMADVSAKEFTATLALSPSTAKIGDVVSVSGTDYPANTDVDLVYHTVEGRYEMQDRTEYIGQRYDEVTQVLATVRSDENGVISGQFDVPVGYGGPHDIRGHVAGEELSQAGLLVQPTITMTPSEGPVGTLIELKIEGVDARNNINTWQILYDNTYLGFATAVQTNGVAIAQFRATGPVGTHVIQAWNNSYNSTPYLAWDTSPFRDVIDVPATFTFETTSDPGYIEPQIRDLSERDAPWPVEGDFPGMLSLTVDRGAVGAPTTLSGSGLPADTDVELSYITMVGNRVSGVGFSELPVPIDSVRTDAEGTFSYDMLIPDDLGGNHRIEATVNDEVQAVTNLVVIPSLESVSATELRAGDELEIHLKGLGWTTYDNTYTVTYDNASIGYVCGFSTNGDVVFKLLVTGEPGTHLIDLYPTIYKGEEPMPKIFSLPQLTYAQDHPMRTIPAIRLTVEIVE